MNKDRKGIIIHLPLAVHHQLRILAAHAEMSMKRWLEREIAKLIDERIGAK